MKDKFLNVIIVLLLLTIWVEYFHPKYDDTERYKIVTADNMLTILLDQKTGETWRNSICSKESNVPGCWEKMRYVDQSEVYLPEGEKVIRREEIKYLKKLQKTREKAGINPEIPAKADEDKDAQKK